jgi:hypothetical protein
LLRQHFLASCDEQIPSGVFDLRTLACALFACLLALVSFSGRSQAAPDTDPPPRWTSPIVIDTLNNGIVLTDVAGGTFFDLDVTGVAEPCGWTQAYTDDAFLALDMNNDGEIGDGTELFGNHTPTMKNGFNALSSYDRPERGGNNDGIISSQDLVYQQLKLWYDANHNGSVDRFVNLTPQQAAAVGYPSMSVMNEVMPLTTKVLSIGLAHTEFMNYDEHTNWFRFRSSGILRNVAPPFNRVDVWDVYLIVDEE